VNVVFVEAGLDIARELYLGDRRRPEHGRRVPHHGRRKEGMEIEEVAARSPEKILKERSTSDYGLFPYQARNLAFKLGLEGASIRAAEAFLRKICRFFLDSDCSMAEINH